ncbi:histone H1 [Pistacia vera]|uniref:histone H1 n=1 Tax=Pistacia vera TaxID=55513 RepID=UPI0012639B21|nr:histone H1 [Pistacia vera]
MTAEAEAEVKPLEKMATRERRPRPTKEKPNPPKEKKPKPPKEKKPKAVSHPPYFEMIKEALLALKDKSGSSPRAIAKYIEEKHKSVLPANFKKMLGVQLKNSAAKGKLIKIRASYMLAEGVVPKEKIRVKEKVPIIIMEKTRSATAAVKKAEVPVKASMKKSKVYSPAKPKQLKSIRTPVVRKARKMAAA